MSRDAGRFIVIVAILLALGLVALYSASAMKVKRGQEPGDTFYFLERQILSVGVALLVFVAASRIPTSFWINARFPLLMMTVVLLCAVLAVGGGQYGARRWLSFGGWNLQPSEIAKLTLPFFLCGMAAAHPERLRTFWGGFAPLFAATGMTCGLILVEPDVGTAAFVGITAAVTMVVAGVRWTHLLTTSGVAAVGAAFLVVFKMEHFLRRLREWWDGSSYQLNQSLIALGSGGWLGEGLGRGSQKLHFLPEVHSDFILAVLGEEMGYVGTLGVVLLFIAFGAAGFAIARRAATPFGFLLAFVLTFTITLQAAINVAVVTGVVPTKGIPLPFFSFGGSSLCFTMAAVGILVRIAHERGETCDSSLPVEVPEAISSRA
ncbi:MAG: putative lipid II flippase FtsW [Planctomycetes bacterium]|nr:putative lipid II flippase FtsW [Planctomycetota bacterium]